MQAFADVVRAGQGALHRGQRVDRRADPRRARAGRASSGFQLVSNQPQYSMLWRVIEAEVVPDLRGSSGCRQIVWSPIAQGVLTGKYQPGEPPPDGSRATDEKGGADMIERCLRDDVLDPGAAAAADRRRGRADAWPSSPSPGCCRTTTSPPRSSGPRRPEQVTENVKAAGVRLPAELMARIDEVLGDVVERDPASLTARATPRSGTARPERRGAYSTGRRLIGPYTSRPASSSVTCSTPAASSSRQVSPIHVSASAWLGKDPRGQVRAVDGRPVHALVAPGPTVHRTQRRGGAADPPEAITPRSASLRCRGGGAAAGHRLRGGLPRPGCAVPDLHRRDRAPARGRPRLAGAVLLDPPPRDARRRGHADRPGPDAGEPPRPRPGSRRHLVAAI